MNIAITGASGQIGKILLNKYLNESYNILCLSKSKKIKNIEKKNKIKWVRHDFSQKPLNKKINLKLNAIIHLANENNNDEKDIIQNQKIISNLFKSFKNVSKFIFFSSQMVYGDPGKLNIKENYNLDPLSNYYSCSKINCENFLNNISKKRNIKSIILRITGILDANTSLVYKIKKDLKKNKDILIYGNKKLCRDYIYSDDLYKIINKIIDTKFSTNKSSTYNFSSFQNKPIYKLAHDMKKILKSNSKIKIKNVSKVRNNFSMNINLIKKDIKFNPTNYKKILKKFCYE